MASGAQDYWQSSNDAMLGLLDDIKSGLLTGSDLLNQLDALDGTMDGKLDLSELNSSTVVTNLSTLITRLDTQITKLTSSVTQLTGIHSDTTDLLAFGEEDTSGRAYDDTWYLISGVNAKRNMLKITLGAEGGCTYSRDGSSSAGTIGSGSEATFYDSPGVWLKSILSDNSWLAHEETAT